MRKFSLVLFSILLISCWHQQWEDRVANGDTGSVTHAGPSPDTFPKEKGPNCIDCIVNNSAWGYAEPGQLGKKYCSSCHYTSSKELVGPGLQGVYERVPSLEWLIGFIRDEDSLFKSGDWYTVILKKKYNSIWNHKFKKQLTNEEINCIFSYLNGAS